MWSNNKIIDVGGFKTKAGDGCSDTYSYSTEMLLKCENKINYSYFKLYIFTGDKKV
jgi:hypothetical protein